MWISESIIFHQPFPQGPQEEKEAKSRHKFQHQETFWWWARLTNQKHMVLIDCEINNVSNERGKVFRCKALKGLRPWKAAPGIESSPLPVPSSSSALFPVRGFCFHERETLLASPWDLDSLVNISLWEPVELLKCSKAKAWTSSGLDPGPGSEDKTLNQRKESQWALMQASSFIRHTRGIPPAGWTSGSPEQLRHLSVPWAPSPESNGVSPEGRPRWGCLDQHF